MSEPTYETYEPKYRRFVPASISALIGLRGRLKGEREEQARQDQAIRDQGGTPAHTADEKLGYWSKFSKDRGILLSQSAARHSRRGRIDFGPPILSSLTSFFVRGAFFAVKFVAVLSVTVLVATGLGRFVAYVNSKVSPTDITDENGLPKALWDNGKDAKAEWAAWLKDHDATLEETFRGSMGWGSRSERETENTPLPDEAYERSVGPNAYVVKQDEINIDRYGGISFSGEVLAQGSTSANTAGGPVSWEMNWDGSGKRVDVSTAYQATFLLDRSGNKLEGANGEPIINIADRLTLVHGHYQDWDPKQSSLTYDYFGSPIPVLNDDSVWGRQVRDVNPAAPLGRYVDPGNAFHYRVGAVEQSTDGQTQTENKTPLAYYVIPAQVQDKGKTIIPSAYFQIKTYDNGPLQTSSGQWNPTAFVYWPFANNNKTNIFWLRGEDASARSTSSIAGVRDTANGPAIDTFTADWLGHNKTRAIHPPIGLEIDPASFLSSSPASPTDVPRFDYAGPTGNSFGNGRSVAEGQGPGIGRSL